MEIKTVSENEIKLMFGTGASSEKSEKRLLAVIRSAVSNGIRGFDTAPSYHTEKALGKCIRHSMEEFCMDRSEFFIQTKVDAWQMAEGKIKEHILNAVKKMEIGYFDAILVHWPVPEYMEQTWADITAMKWEGVVRYTGICNLRMRQLEKLHDLGAMPQIIQLERNPLRTCDREIRFCLERGISVQAYSPLCKMHRDIADNNMLKDIADKYHKSIGQIVMRWQLDTGAIPIFTSKKVFRIKEYAELDDFILDEAEIKKINSMNKNYKMYLESCTCPGF